ncbi:MAG: hypothetical protein B7X04_03010 [Parcubacteria group bacterium 21-54-25]|nr:MAG: hypothetical protein B7X04_03010 [Parcubacteria group bacterium 21-54-25]
MQQPQQLIHPQSGETVFGKPLESGDEVQKGDLYPSTNGKWEPFPIPDGISLRDGSVLVVRPA